MTLSISSHYYGRILFYDENGDPVDFLQGDLLPGNGVRIDVSSFEEPVNEVTRTVTEVVVSVHQNGAVVFYQERDGAVTMSDIVTANVESPVGVAIEDGNTTAVSIGNQTVQLQALAVRFDVNQSGSIGSLCQTIEDSRDTSVPVESPLTTFLEVEVELPGSEPNDPPFRFRVPTFVRGFPQRASGDLDGGPFTGPEVLRVCLATADLGFTGLAHVDSNETGWLGYKPSCTAAAVETPNGTVYPMRPRFFYIREAPPFLFEQEQNADPDFIIDLTSDCNRDGGDPWIFSVFVPGARNVRPSDGPNDVADSSCNDADDGTVDCKLNSLDGVMSEIAEDVRRPASTRKRRGI